MTVLSDLQMINIAIAEDNSLVLEGLEALLELNDNIEIAFAANNATLLLNYLENTQPQVILMDIRMPGIDGLEATKIIKEKYPEVYVVMLSNHDDSSTIKKSLKVGADGYLLKNITKDELKIAIEKVASGETYFCKEVQDQIFRFIARKDVDDSQRNRAATPSNITSREFDVMTLICDEYTSGEIAAELYISKNTVETHRRNLLAKLNCKSSIGLVKYAIMHNLYKH